MGAPISTNTPVIPGTDYIVSPYGADTDISLYGTVSYTQFSSNDPQLSQLNDFICYKTGHEFDGNRMMIVEWYNVAKANESAVSLFSQIFQTHFIVVLFHIFLLENFFYLPIFYFSSI